MNVCSSFDVGPSAHVLPPTTNFSKSSGKKSQLQVEIIRTCFTLKLDHRLALKHIEQQVNLPSNPVVLLGLPTLADAYFPGSNIDEQYCLMVNHLIKVINEVVPLENEMGIFTTKNLRRKKSSIDYRNGKEGVFVRNLNEHQPLPGENIEECYKQNILPPKKIGLGLLEMLSIIFSKTLGENTILNFDDHTHYALTEDLYSLSEDGKFLHTLGIKKTENGGLKIVAMPTKETKNFYSVLSVDLPPMPTF